MTDYAAKTAKRRPGRRRAAPRQIPAAVFHLALWLAVLGLFFPKPWGLVAAAPAVLVGLAFFVQRWRRVGYDMIQGARSELDR